MRYAYSPRRLQVWVQKKQKIIPRELYLAVVQLQKET